MTWAVAAGVPRLSGRSAVVAEAVGLHDQPEVRPKEVDLESVDALFAERHRQLRCFDYPTEIDLQVRIGELKEELVEQKAQRADTRLAVEAGELFAQCFGVNQAALIGVVDRPLERHGFEFGGQIDQSAHWRGDRNAVAEADVARCEAWSASNQQARPPQFAAAEDAHVDTPRHLPADPEQCCSAAVAECGVFATGEHGGHPATTLVERRPANRIDTASDKMKTAGFATVLDRARAEAKFQQLPAGHDPVLSASKFPSLSRARIRH
jgi:hypothetical protein